MTIQTMGKTCPGDPEDTSERLYLKQLEESEARAFQIHLRRCPACRAIYERTVVFIDSIRLAAATLLGRGNAANG